MQTIEWVKKHELPTGGIEAWAGYGKAYPECSGYIIPTLLDYGETTLANRLGDWLESIQNNDGSFDGLDGVPRAFDTAACIEGLQALERRGAVDKALVWMETQLIDGRLRVEPNTKETHIYNLRALAIIGKRLPTVPEEELRHTRSHYFAYALEGLRNMGLDITKYLESYADGKSLLPMLMNGSGSDTCATAQVACLCLKNNISCDGLVEAVRGMVDSDGGVFHDSGDRRKTLWTAKYYLDMERLAKGSTRKTNKKKVNG